ncbi:MAG: adenylyltransferase, partial [Acidithiobacillus sp.]|nr:adenylyltransferase [Acidithiobacillus sp.]
MSTATVVHVLTPRQRCDLELLLNGAFAPLEGFMDEATWDAVLTRMRLPDGRLWPIPITLELGQAVPVGSELRLDREDGTPLARMQVTACYRPDRRREALLVYGSDD